MITLRFDGLFRTISPNHDPREVTGLMCYGWVIFRDGRLVAHGHGAFARPEWASSNSANFQPLEVDYGDNKRDGEHPCQSVPGFFLTYTPDNDCDERGKEER